MMPLVSAVGIDPHYLVSYAERHKSVAESGSTFVCIHDRSSSLSNSRTGSL